MAKYIVTYLIEGYQDIEVEAANECEAMEKSEEKLPNVNFGELYGIQKLEFDAEDIREVKDDEN